MTLATLNILLVAKLLNLIHSRTARKGPPLPLSSSVAKLISAFGQCCSMCGSQPIERGEYDS